MVEEYGKEAYDKGLSIYTTVASHLQNAASNALRDGLMTYDKRHGYRKPTQNLGDYDTHAWLAALKKEDVVDDRLYPAAVVSIGEQFVQVLLSDSQVITVPWSGLSWARPALENGDVGALPKQASNIVKVGDLIRVIENKNNTWALTQIPEVQGAIVSLNPQNGALLALSGGFDYDTSNFNRAIQAERQPGSNFKPFIYSAALSKGYTLASMINDAPVVVEDTGENQLWRPTNDTLKFYGPTPLRIGLIKSRNLVSIRLLQAVGIPYALSYVQRFGFDPNTLPNALSLALGSGTVTPLHIAEGYAVFANGGYRVIPYFIARIQNQRGKMIYQANPEKACPVCITDANPPTDQVPTPEAHRVITTQNAYLITQAMRDVIRRGTGRGARVLHRSDIAGKTGTTNDQVDAWFSGFNNNVETTVWVGFDNLKSLREYGARAALPIWIHFMKKALQGTPEATMPQPPGMITVRIDPKNGLRAHPNQAGAKFELFRQKYAPRVYSPDSSPSVYGGSEANGVENSTDTVDEPLF